jgi:hypothetical protein
MKLPIVRDQRLLSLGAPEQQRIENEVLALVGARMAGDHPGPRSQPTSGAAWSSAPTLGFKVRPAE